VTNSLPAPLELVGCRKSRREGQTDEGVLIVQETIKDQAMFDAYRKDVMATLTEVGGQFMVRGGNLTVVEGDRRAGMLRVFDLRELFDSAETPPARREVT
jgi:uncharacterized protein (DUF1330 family)